MEYIKLPPVKNDKYLHFSHFPNRFYAAVFRLWETVPAEKIANALNIDKEKIEKAASDMGLPNQKVNKNWLERGYISVIKAAWQILPYDAILRLLDFTEDEFAACLKDEDFLDVKMGFFKPYCPPIEYEECDVKEIKNIVSYNFSDLFDGMEPFDFYGGEVSFSETKKSDGIRLIYSYSGLYASVLDKDISISYPDELLKNYQAVGVNAIWLPVVLYQMVPFPFDEKYSIGYEERQKRLRELIKKAEKYGIKVFLYLNEPRSMPMEFFENHPDLLGSRQDSYGALCSSNPKTMEYLKYAVSELLKSVKGIGGFFLITASENLTNCKSRLEATKCERCKDVPTYKLISDVIKTISEESKKIDKNIKTIAWSWAWDDLMTKEEIKKCISLIPEDVIIQCNSEAKMEYTIGGVKGSVRDYSISIPGPAPFAKDIWEMAKEEGHEICAKVQINDSWEISTLPFVPVFDLIREHMTGLKNEGVKHTMLSWTLGGYPSVSLEIASKCLENPSEEKYNEILKRRYGENWEKVKASASVFSEAFRNFPFDMECLYFGPQNSGPSNPLYEKPSGFEATMTGFAYDDIDKWRSIYPRDVYINQFKKLSEEWKNGLSIIKDMPDNDFKQMAEAGYIIFRSTYLQAEFTDKRDKESKEYLLKIVNEEKELAVSMYSLMQRNSLLGFEAANHYYYTKGMMAEKLLNLKYVEEQLKRRDK